jgi:hypothetical protein
MPKDAKKEVKKVFPLLTTTQSNAYKEQVKVMILRFRKKGMFYWWALMLNCSRLFRMR